MRALLTAIISISLSGCSFLVKPPIVADYEKLNHMGATTRKDDVEAMLGGPQSNGLHLLHGKVYDLSFYYGFSGRLGIGSANLDSGTAFLSYDSQNLVSALYFTSRADGPERSLESKFSIKELSEKLILGKTRIEAMYELLGRPRLSGRRLDSLNRIVHNIAFWDASQVQNNGATKEKWLPIGFDNIGVAQDIVWASSDPEDISEMGAIGEQSLRQVSRLTIAGILPVFEPQSISTSTRIDATQVDAVLRGRPKNVQAVITAIGLPSARGIKTYLNDAPMVLSNWSYTQVKMLGHEQRYTRSKEAEAEAQDSESYMVMDVTQSRLIIGHEKDGEIKEILWLRPIK